MASKPVTRFLMQESKDRKPHLYAWTASLAQRPDMRPISAEEAREFIQKARDEETRQRKARIAAEIEAIESAQESGISLDEEYPDREIRPVVEELDALQDRPVSDDRMASQDDLLGLEIKKVNGLKKASSLEEYMLKKYRVSLLQRDLDDMKTDAKVALQELARQQKLFKVLE